jgi:cobyrinic acid a,c-diamide synthase
MSGARTCRAFVVAGPSSGAGKTTVTLGLMAALRARGLMVQPFKCGPDFIDPGHHTRVCGRPSRNLDTWMVSDEANRRAFHRHAATADVSVIEGVMGLFDGARGSGAGSTAATANLLGVPIVLVVDASGMGASAAAVVKGFATFDPTVSIAGVIFNRVATASHYQLLLEACESIQGVTPLGYLPRDPQWHIPERHLGLLTAEEGALSQDAVSHLATLVERHIDLECLLKLSAHVATDDGIDADVVQSRPLVTIGVARDQAFCFYYEDNLDALRRAGAELLPFSPLNDGELPVGVDALYFGGGYPEVWAGPLSNNVAMRAAVASFIRQSGVVYAECGGLMYLAETVRMQDGATWPMVGALPITIAMTDRLQRFGYAEVVLTRDCLLGAAGTAARGHSFHYSRIDNPPAGLDLAYSVHDARHQKQELEGFIRDSVLASYVHIHFSSNPDLATSFVQHILARRQAGRSRTSPS